MSTTASPPPRPAATTLLLDDAQPFRVFMVKRAATLNFMAGTHVFPGGRVDAQDHALVTAGRVLHAGATVLAERMGLPAVEALAYVSAAARELLEEAGILLVRGADAALAERTRAQLASGTAWPEVLAAADLRVDGDAFSYVAHWVTPVVEPRRFSARFFVASLPAGQVATVDQGEAVSGDWLTPSHAITAHARGDLVLPPPTLTLLDMLSRAPSASAWRDVDPRLLRAVEPVMVHEDDVPVLAFPGDRLHPEADGVPGAATRVEIRDGRFVLGHSPRNA